MEVVEKCREKYNVEFREKDLCMFYTHVQALLSKNEPDKWNIRQLDQEKSNEEMAEYMADFLMASVRNMILSILTRFLGRSTPHCQSLMKLR